MNYIITFTLLMAISSSSVWVIGSAEANDIHTAQQTDERKNPTMSQDTLNRTSVEQRFGNYDDGRFDERLSDSIARNVLSFAHDIGLQLSEQSGGKSEIFSPLSLISSLSLLLLGARDKSYQELKKLLRLDSDLELSNNPQRFHEEFGYMLADLKLKDDMTIRARHKVNWRLMNTRRKMLSERNNNKPFEHIIKVANGMFVQYKYAINPTYRDVLENVYRSQFAELDFEHRPAEARNFINSWVDSATNGKISQIISDTFPRSTNVVLASVLYFKGFWENPFVESATTEDNFYPDGPENPPVRVKMMPNIGVFPYYEAPEYNCRIIGLPYRGNLTTMYIIVPSYTLHPPTRASVKQMQYYLNADNIENMISKMQLKSGILAFPKMHFVRNTNMKNMLIRLGLHDIFIPGASDLTLIGKEAKEFIAPIAQRANMPPLTVTQAPAMNLTDRFNEAPLIFSRFSEDGLGGANIGRRRKRSTLRNKFVLENIEKQRQSTNTLKSDLFVEDILHKVDFTVNEQGTEAAAATLTYLRRSGADVIMRVEGPFLMLIRHDPTRLPLFYGIINEPEL